MTKEKPNLKIHQRNLTKILVDIVKEVGEKIVFKGGTCAFLFYDLPRMSLDLDFDLLQPLSKEEMDNLKVVLEKHGEIKDFYDKRFTTFFLISYKKNAPNIKVEFNKRKWEYATFKQIWFLGVEMKIADQVTLFSQKIVALTDRRQPVARDLFDIHYFLELDFPLKEKMIKERTGKGLEDYLKECISFIKDHYTSKNVLQGLGEILEEEQKRWAKKNLKKETVSLLEDKIQEIKGG